MIVNIPNSFGLAFQFEHYDVFKENILFRLSSFALGVFAITAEREMCKVFVGYVPRYNPVAAKLIYSQPPSC